MPVLQTQLTCKPLSPSKLLPCHQRFVCHQRPLSLTCLLAVCIPLIFSSFFFSFLMIIKFFELSLFLFLSFILPFSFFQLCRFYSNFFYFLTLFVIILLHFMPCFIHLYIFIYICMNRFLDMPICFIYVI